MVPRLGQQGPQGRRRQDRDGRLGPVAEPVVQGRPGRIQPGRARRTGRAHAGGVVHHHHHRTGGGRGLEGDPDREEQERRQDQQQREETVEPPAPRWDPRQGAEEHEEFEKRTKNYSKMLHRLCQVLIVIVFVLFFQVVSLIALEMNV